MTFLIYAIIYIAQCIFLYALDNGTKRKLYENSRLKPPGVDALDWILILLIALVPILGPLGAFVATYMAGRVGFSFKKG